MQNDNEILHEEIDQLREEGEEGEGVEVVQTEIRGRYTSEFRNLIYKLLAGNICRDKIPGAIKDFIAFAGKKTSHAPSIPTIGAMNIERLGVSQIQLGEVSNTDGLTLSTDETAKCVFFCLIYLFSHSKSF